MSARYFSRADRTDVTKECEKYLAGLDARDAIIRRLAAELERVSPDQPFRANLNEVANEFCIVQAAVQRQQKKIPLVVEIETDEVPK